MKWLVLQERVMVGLIGLAVVFTCCSSSSPSSSSYPIRKRESGETSHPGDAAAASSSASSSYTKNVYRKKVPRTRDNKVLWGSYPREMFPSNHLHLRGSKDTWSTDYNDEDPPCSVTGCAGDFQRKKWHRIMQIKQAILAETGIVSPPNMTGFVIPANPLLSKIIHEINVQNDPPKFDQRYGGASYERPMGDDYEIRKIDFFVPGSRGPDFVRIPGRQPIHFFNLSEEHSSNVAVANLHILLKGLSPQQSPPVLPPPDQKEAMISVFKITRPKYHNGLHRLSSVVTDLRVPYNGGDTQWVKIDVYSMVHDWLIRPEDNLGFVVKATTNSGAAVAVSSVEEDLPNAPLLQLKVRQVRNERTKRYASNRVCSEKKPEKNCCLYPLTMDFTLLKFDFIVAPKKYVANFCRGKCPPLLAHQMPHVTLLQQMFPNSTESNHGACCGGSDMAPLKIVYFDGQRIKISTINDMVVKACSCN